MVCCFSRRYDSATADDFRPHYDATTEDLSEPGSVWRSYLTVLLYLNDCATPATVEADSGNVDSSEGSFEGGRTLFLAAKGRHPQVSVRPSTGAVTFFEHDQYHAGEAVTAGVKWILRTDVMFRIGDDIDVINRIDQVVLERRGVGGDEGLGGPRGGDGKADTVEALLKRLGLEELGEALTGGGFSGSVESLRAPGKGVLQTLLSEIVGDSRAELIVDEVFR